MERPNEGDGPAPSPPSSYLHNNQPSGDADNARFVDDDSPLLADFDLLHEPVSPRAAALARAGHAPSQHHLQQHQHQQQSLIFGHAGDAAAPAGVARDEEDGGKANATESRAHNGDAALGLPRKRGASSRAGGSPSETAPRSQDASRLRSADDATAVPGAIFANGTGKTGMASTRGMQMNGKNSRASVKYQRLRQGHNEAISKGGCRSLIQMFDQGLLLLSSFCIPQWQSTPECHPEMQLVQ
ncbi:Hypothetical Protein FCC1311_067332 [Hondaea fermentalgiana]|uniref:Uncharacterized protein n=1 Tax=Hondaea fermentalgiana TaxID=2315210 RepID=A0A2R5GPG5_9STRA|nr:Hypothetical Protein FCC1311_067332 [Hondaea fermentalgiana]|eukprot:GBG30513.1 Hypothetical Protein FCC1311_067332 [Hondaea fermentalgiana]